MLRLSRLSDYAISIMCEMALKQNEILSAKYLSERTRIGESTVMKLLKLLTKSQLLISVRGNKGGYMIDKTPHEISILDIVRAIDGPVQITLCSENTLSCECALEASCTAKHGLRKVNTALAHTLSQFNLNDFTQRSGETYVSQ